MARAISRGFREQKGARRFPLLPLSFWKQARRSLSCAASATPFSSFERVDELVFFSSSRQYEGKDQRAEAISSSPSFLHCLASGPRMYARPLFFFPQPATIYMNRCDYLDPPGSPGPRKGLRLFFFFFLSSPLTRPKRYHFEIARGGLNREEWIGPIPPFFSSPSPLEITRPSPSVLARLPSPNCRDALHEGDGPHSPSPPPPAAMLKQVGRGRCARGFGGGF